MRIGSGVYILLVFAEMCSPSDGYHCPSLSIFSSNNPKARDRHVDGDERLRFNLDWI